MTEKEKYINEEARILRVKNAIDRYRKAEPCSSIGILAVSLDAAGILIDVVNNSVVMLQYGVTVTECDDRYTVRGEVEVLRHCLTLAQVLRYVRDYFEGVSDHAKCCLNHFAMELSK